MIQHRFHMRDSNISCPPDKSQPGLAYPIAGCGTMLRAGRRGFRRSGPDRDIEIKLFSNRQSSHNRRRLSVPRISQNSCLAISSRYETSEIARQTEHLILLDRQGEIRNTAIASTILCRDGQARGVNDIQAAR